MAANSELTAKVCLNSCYLWVKMDNFECLRVENYHVYTRFQNYCFNKYTYIIYNI